MEAAAAAAVTNVPSRQPRQLKKLALPLAMGAVGLVAVLLLVLWMANVLAPRFKCDDKTGKCSADFLNGPFSGKNAKHKCVTSACATGTATSGGGGAIATYDCVNGKCVANASGAGAFRERTCGGGCVYCNRGAAADAPTTCVAAPANQPHAPGTKPRPSCDVCAKTYSCRRDVKNSQVSNCTLVDPGDGQFATATCGSGCYGCSGDNKCVAVANNDTLNGVYASCGGGANTCDPAKKFTCSVGVGCVPKAGGEYWSISQCLASGCAAPPGYKTQVALTVPDDAPITVTPSPSPNSTLWGDTRRSNVLANIGTFTMPPGCKRATLNVSVTVTIPGGGSGSDFVWASLAVFETANLARNISAQKFTNPYPDSSTATPFATVATSPGKFVQGAAVLSNESGAVDACKLIAAMQTTTIEMQLHQPQCDTLHNSDGTEMTVQTDGSSETWPGASGTMASVLRGDDKKQTLRLVNAVLLRPLQSDLATPRPYGVFVYLTVSTNDAIVILPSSSTNVVTLDPPSA